MNTSNLTTTREELHKAIQLVSYVPRNHLPNDPTDASASLIWDEDEKMLKCVEVDGIVVGLNIDQFSIIVKNHSATKIITLSDKEFEDALIELDEIISDKGLPAGQLSTDLPYELPESVHKRGEPFGKADKRNLLLYADLYNITASILGELFKGNEKASDIRCWPHHFDMAILLSVETHDDPEKSKTIGFGISPGDSGYNEPYFYLTPWPYPDKAKLYKPDPPAFWNTEGWTGAVLKYSDLEEGDIRNAVTAFYQSGLSKLK